MKGGQFTKISLITMQLGGNFSLWHVNSVNLSIKGGQFVKVSLIFGGSSSLRCVKTIHKLGQVIKIGSFITIQLGLKELFPTTCKCCKASIEECQFVKFSLILGGSSFL
ncbi:hypothetical protein CEXT_578631 [Caerostris extrusa]|uniref:Uncharacterized protein n=1 Tax=Caerostris extrusa TaxID=172846 RepID=A0AAV4WXW0_CAEEX|nr:hypothetical protein CEXT_578631 [Caerostris extrusa]